MRAKDGCKERITGDSRFPCIDLPSEIVGEFWNACTDPCDTLCGPCVCGAWHHIHDWPEWLIEFILVEGLVCKNKMDGKDNESLPS